MASNGWALALAFDYKIMAFGFASNGLINGLVKQLIALRIAQWLAQVRSIVLPKAHIQGAGTGNPHTVAAFAKIMGQWRDETHATTGFLNLNITGGAAGFVSNVGQREFFLQPLF